MAKKRTGKALTIKERSKQDDAAFLAGRNTGTMEINGKSFHIMPDGSLQPINGSKAQKRVSKRKPKPAQGS